MWEITPQTSHWVYSITTRIKTENSGYPEEDIRLIEYIPLQQGLRQLSYSSMKNKQYLIEYIPLQQGLRPITIFSICFEL